MTLPKKIKTSTNGSFSADIEVPFGNAIGDSQVEFFTDTRSHVFTNFTIAALALVLGSSSGSPGMKVSISGTDFEGGKALKLMWDGSILLPVKEKIITTRLGGFTSLFTVPKTASQGAHSISATTGTENFMLSVPFTVSAPALTLDSIRSQPTGKILISGNNFTPLSDVKFLWDNTVELSADSEMMMTNESGFFSISVIVPGNASGGYHTIKAYSDDDVFATGTVTIATGILNLSKESGVSGGSFQVTGSNFESNGAISFLWDDTDMHIASVIADARGGFTADIGVPTTNAGVHTLKAMTGDQSFAFVDFTVDAPMTSIQPSISSPGQYVTVQGSNFIANQKIMVTVNDTEVSTDEVMTDGNGNFSTRIRLPYTLASSVRIGVRTGDADRVILEFPLRQYAAVKAMKQYGEWGMIIIFLCIAWIFFHKTDIVQKISSRMRDIFSKK
jgi:hypothetical protein